MDLQLNKNKPLGLQICEQVCAHIVKGDVKPGDRIMSIRDISKTSKVNPNTIQSAFSKLKRQGVLISIRGTGWYVTSDIELVNMFYKKIVEKKTKQYLSEMSLLGLTLDEIKKYLKEF